MNTLGTSAFRAPLREPGPIIAERARFGRDAIPELNRATSLYCPSGRWPSRGWVLVTRSDYDRLDKYATDLELEVSSTVTLKNLCIAQAQCVTRGIAADKNAIYLVELTDGRGILGNEWFQFPATTTYNASAPAYTGDYYSATLNSGTAWTWSTMVGDLWAQMSTFLGSYPGLPTTPSGTPDGFWFPGVSAWESLCGILDQLGMTVACDLTSTTPFTIVYGGAADSAFTSLETKYSSNLQDDAEWIDVGAARVPGTVTVLFRRHIGPGLEETVRRDSLQWSTSAYYQKNFTAPTTFANAVGKHFLWSDFMVRYDEDGNPVAADVTTANTIGAERVQQYFAKIYRQTYGYMSRVYAGALPFATGSLVDGVAWIQDSRRAGWKTKLLRGPQPPWDWRRE